MPLGSSVAVWRKRGVVMLPVTVEVTEDVTVSVVESEIDPELAWIVVLPTAAPYASPLPPMMTATAGFCELHATVPVRYCVLPSE